MTRLFISCALALSANSAFAVKPSPLYIYAIDPFGGRISTPRAINDQGQVAGIAYNPADFSMQAFATGPNGKGVTNIGALLGATRSEGFGINNGGVVVGQYFSESTVSTRAFVYEPGKGARNLFAAQQSPTEVARDINNNDVVVGYYNIDSDTKRPKGFQIRVDEISPSILPDLGGGYSNAYAVNDIDQIAMAARDSAGIDHAAVYDIGAAALLDYGTFRGTSAAATAIGELGELGGLVVASSGSSAFSTSKAHPEGTVRDTLGGISNRVNGIGPTGSVVGTASLADRNKLVGMVANAKGKVYNVNGAIVNAPKGVEISQLIAVNQRAQAVGIGNDGISYIVCPTRNCQ